MLFRGMVTILFFKKKTRKIWPLQPTGMQCKNRHQLFALVPYSQQYLISEQNLSCALFCGEVILKSVHKLVAAAERNSPHKKQASTFTLVPDNQ